MTDTDREQAKFRLKVLADAIKAGTIDADKDGAFKISGKEGQAILTLFGPST